MLRRSATAAGLSAAALAVSSLTLLGSWSPAAAEDGAISGTVKVKIPDGWKPATLKVDKDGAACCRAVPGSAAETSPCAGKDALPDDTLVVSKDGGLANAVVFLVEAPKDGKRDWSFLKKQLHQEVNELANPPVVTFDQKFCQFKPHILVVPAGWSVLLASQDPVAHNTHTFPFNNPAFNETIPAAKLDDKGLVASRSEVGPKTDATAKGEFVKVVCDVHPWMTAYWAVMEHPYVAVTDAEGKFTIDKIPAGTYKVKVWHERFGTKLAGPKGVEVVVEAGKTAELKGLKELPVPEQK
jgi:hypothetical protein